MSDGDDAAKIGEDLDPNAAAVDAVVVSVLPGNFIQTPVSPIATATSFDATTTTPNDRVMWQWEDGGPGSGRWLDYGKNEQVALENAFAGGESQIKLAIAGKTYIIENIQGKSPTQRNSVTNGRRAIRRNEFVGTATAIPVAAPGTTAVAVTNVTTLSSPPAETTTTPSAAPTTIVQDEYESCRMYRENCSKMSRDTFLSTNEMFDDPCITDDDRDCFKMAFDCFENSEERELPCGNGVCGYIMLIPFLPIALVWLFVKWVVCTCGPILIVSTVVRILAKMTCRVTFFALTKSLMLLTWLGFFVLYLPLYFLAEAVFLPVYQGVSFCVSWICSNIVVPVMEAFLQCITRICVAIGNAVVWTYENVLTPIGNAISSGITWVYTSMIEPCMSAVGRCITAVYDALSTCCAFVYTQISACVTAICNALSTCCVFVYTQISACVTAICNALSACCSFMYTQILVPVCTAISQCCTWCYENTIVPLCAAVSAAATCVYVYILTPIGRAGIALCDALGAICGAIWACMDAVYTNAILPCLTAIGSVLAAIGNAVYAVLAAIGNAVYAVLAAIGNVVYTVVAAIGNAVYAVLAAIGNAVYAVLAAMGRVIAATLSVFS